MSRTNEDLSCDISLESLTVERPNSYLSEACMAFITSNARIYREDGPILFIDDQNSILKMGEVVIKSVLNALQLSHIPILKACGPNNAFMHLAESSGFSCIITDAEMPHFISNSADDKSCPAGVAFARVLRSHINGTQIPIYLSSSTHCTSHLNISSEHRIISETHRAFFNGDILKPVTAEKLTPVFEVLYFNRSV